MGVIHIDNVDEQVMKSLRLRAELKGRSLEDEIRELLAEATGPHMSPRDFAEEAREIRAMTPKGIEQTDSTQIIRELRDRGYAGR